MNQILVSEKVYVTPGMKRKKKLYRFEFFISIFLVCILSSYAIYAEYDRNKSEQVSKEILASLEVNKKEEKLEQIIVVLNHAFEEENNEIDELYDATLEESLNEDEIQETENTQTNNNIEIVTTASGTEYYTIGRINIPSINVNYPILSTTTDELLKISPCKFWGADPNQVGNLCIVGHNYWNRLFFSKVPNLEKGDIIEITDLSGVTLQYMIYDKFTIEPDDLECTSQETGGRKEVTVITCTNDGSQRVVVKAREK